MAWTQLATLTELPPGALIEVELGEQLFALCNIAGSVRALHGICPHQGGPLGEGALHGEFVTCPWHMWEFHSGSGACGFNPALNIPTYPVRVEGDRILVDITGVDIA